MFYDVDLLVADNVVINPNIWFFINQFFFDRADSKIWISTLVVSAFHVLGNTCRLVFTSTKGFILGFLPTNFAFSSLPDGVGLLLDSTKCVKKIAIYIA